jgi:hypothetical protein
MFRVRVSSVQDAKARIRASSHHNLSARRALNHLIGGGRSIQMVQNEGLNYEVNLKALVGKDTISVAFNMNVCKEPVQTILEELGRAAQENVKIKDLLQSWPGLCDDLTNEANRKQLKPFKSGRFKVHTTGCVKNGACAR